MTNGKKRWILCLAAVAVVGLVAWAIFAWKPVEPMLHAGFAEADITPALERGKPVYMAGFGHDRKAVAVHDPLKVRAVVLKHGGRKIALVGVDVVGLFQETTARVRAGFPDFDAVIIGATHNHEGPDTMGLWGPNWFTNGVDPVYMKLVEEKIAEAVRDADSAARPVTARIGTTSAPDLLHDNREPYVKHDDLVALQFLDAATKQPVGVIVQWNCHPETLDSKNKEISADFVGYTVDEVSKAQGCPVVYLTGTVGGLMTSLQLPVKSEQGELLADGTFAKTERYGRLVGQRANDALAQSTPIALTPLRAHRTDVYLPLENALYKLARQMGVLRRQAYVWTGDPYHAEPATNDKDATCLRTEIAWLRLGQLDVACIPGEIYPELVLGRVQDPADPGADFPDAPIEPAIYNQLTGPHRMIVGLANDEIGYIIPKRQWDKQPPYRYGRQKPQYGEDNSVGPETAPILCRAFQEMLQNKK